ncbi:MAG: tol-pal system protein YbgF [Pseudomonadota bacterium]
MSTPAMMRARGFLPLYVALALAAGPFAGPARSQGLVQVPTQDLRALVERVDRLQRDIDVLQRQLARPGVVLPAAAPPAGPAAAPPAAISAGFIAHTDSRFSDLESQFRELTGKLEELTFKMTQIASRLDKLVGDVDFRLSALERAAAPDAAPAREAGAPAAAPAPGTPGAPPGQVAPGQTRLVLVPGGPPAQAGPAPAVLPAGPPEAQYEFAYGELQSAQRGQADFVRAEQALRAFLVANSNHRLAGNAQYWLGETYYVRKDYETAAATFADGLKKYPSTDKAPDNLLKLAMSLGQLNRKNDACGTLSEFAKRYPQANPALKQTAAREKQRLGCA